MNCFVISLTDKPRNPQLISQLRNAGLDPKILLAFDGRGLKTHELRKYLDLTAVLRQSRISLSGAEIGCALSHLQSYQLAKGRPRAWSFVFEDDAEIVGDLKGALREISNLRNRRPTIITFFAPRREIRKKTLKALEASGKKFWLGQFFLPPDYALGYALNSAAINLASQYELVSGQADWPPWAPAIDFWGIYPWPVKPFTSAEGSHIEPERSLARATGQANGFAQRVREVLHSETNNVFRGSHEFLRPSRVRVWKQYMGSYEKYLTKIFLPHISRSLRKRHNEQLTKESDSPFVR